MQVGRSRKEEGDREAEKRLVWWLGGWVMLSGRFVCM